FWARAASIQPCTWRAGGLCSAAIHPLRSEEGMSEADSEASEPRFLVPLPGGRVARVPLDVLERYAAEGAKLAHDKPPPRPEVETTTLRAGASTITINVFAAT